MALLASPRYPFKEAVIAGAPEDPGVYALYFGDRLLYLGATGSPGPGTIRERLAAHMSGELSPSAATHYTWEITRHAQSRLAELLRFLASDLPPYNDPASLR